MTVELQFLTMVALLTGVMWVPYVLDRIVVGGLFNAVGYPGEPKSLHGWAARLKLAHANAVENLVIFATLVLVANALNIHNDITVMVCVVYFWARLAHAVVYTLAVPWLRTLAFAAGFVCQIVLACQILQVVCQQATPLVS